LCNVKKNVKIICADFGSIFRSPSLYEDDYFTRPPRYFDRRWITRDFIGRSFTDSLFVLIFRGDGLSVCLIMCGEAELNVCNVTIMMCIIFVVFCFKKETVAKMPHTYMMQFSCVVISVLTRYFQIKYFAHLIIIIAFKKCQQQNEIY